MRLRIATKFSIFSAALITVTATSIITAFYFGGTRSLLTNSLRQYSTLSQQEGQQLNYVRITMPDRYRSMVMNNLISSAVKFSPPGELTDVTLNGDDEQLRIRVNDKGPGVPLQFSTHLLDKFTPVDSSNTRQKGGTEPGLNIARLLVDRHHGTIEYHDNPGGGSSFRVTLPISPQDQSEMTDS